MALQKVRLLKAGPGGNHVRISFYDRGEHDGGAVVPALLQQAVRLHERRLRSESAAEPRRFQEVPPPQRVFGDPRDHRDPGGIGQRLLHACAHTRESRTQLVAQEHTGGRNLVFGATQLRRATHVLLHLRQDRRRDRVARRHLPQVDSGPPCERQGETRIERCRPIEVAQGRLQPVGSPAFQLPLTLQERAIGLRVHLCDPLHLVDHLVAQLPLHRARDLHRNVGLQAQDVLHLTLEAAR